MKSAGFSGGNGAIPEVEGQGYRLVLNGPNEVGVKATSEIFHFISLFLSGTMHSSSPVPELAIQLIYICGPWAREIKRQYRQYRQYYQKQIKTQQQHVTSITHT